VRQAVSACLARLRATSSHFLTVAARHAARDCQERHGIAHSSPATARGRGCTSRGDVHYVVTEHGVAYLHGKTLRQRAEGSIQVADPKFRDHLEEFAVKSKLLGADRARVAI
jgi:hypothetical protein